jgi:toxin-antitoxin system PIN domain toxin
MPTLVDVNLLLAVSYEGHAHHVPALAWLNEQGTGQIVLCRSTQLSLLRLLCNRSVMAENVCSMDRAWAVYEVIHEDDRFRFYAESEGLETVLRKFTQSAQPSPKLWQDAYLAAFAVSSNIHLTTFDKGFQQYNGLQLTLLVG